MKTSLTYKAKKIVSGNAEMVEDQLVVEESLLINVNYKPFTLTMRTPGDEEQLVIGLLFTETIIDKNTPYTYTVIEKKKGIITAVNIEIDEKHLNPNLLNKRNLLSVSSCGICGKLELNEKCDHLPPIEKNIKINVDQLHHKMELMKKHQNIFNKTGGCHAASAFDKKGELLCIKEDIGRHNAVDKVIGELILSNNLNNVSLVLVSGRVSYEIITKLFIASIPVLAAVSSVSSLAVDLAEEYGITILGFCRGDKSTCYSNCERLI